MRKISVLIVDDHSVVRMGLAAIIGIQRDLTVCGEAGSGADAVALAAKLHPDVVIMDLMMPGMDGAESTAEVLKASPGSKVLILTTFGTSAELARAMKAGASGAITKSITNKELTDAIRATAGGERRFTPEIAQALEDRQTEPDFTPRQKSVLDSITRGLSNDDIATLLGISKARVKQHLNEIYGKLGAANRAEAVAIALRKHLLKI